MYKINYCLLDTLTGLYSVEASVSMGGQVTWLSSSERSTAAQGGARFNSFIAGNDIILTVGVDDSFSVYKLQKFGSELKPTQRMNIDSYLRGIFSDVGDGISHYYTDNRMKFDEERNVLLVTVKVVRNVEYDGYIPVDVAVIIEIDITTMTEIGHWYCRTGPDVGYDYSSALPLILGTVGDDLIYKSQDYIYRLTETNRSVHPYAGGYSNKGDIQRYLLGESIDDTATIVDGDILCAAGVFRFAGDRLELISPNIILNTDDGNNFDDVKFVSQFDIKSHEKRIFSIGRTQYRRNEEIGE